MNYYQGFHDVCSMLLLILGERDAIDAATVLCIFWLADFMEPSLDSTLHHMNFVRALIDVHDQELSALFSSTPEFNTFFCTLGLYRHIVANHVVQP
jgi:hypothetical protein